MPAGPPRGGGRHYWDCACSGASSGNGGTGAVGLRSRLWWCRFHLSGGAVTGEVDWVEAELAGRDNLFAPGLLGVLVTLAVLGLLLGEGRVALAELVVRDVAFDFLAPLAVALLWALRL